MTTTLAAPYTRRTDETTAEWYLEAHMFTWLAEGAQTGGQFSLAEIEIRAGAEPPPHTHSIDDEAWYVLDGEITFIVGDQVIQATRGDFVWTPRGVQHAFQVTTPAARLLMLVTPAGAEEVFHAMSRPAPAAELPPAPQGPPPAEAIDAMLRLFDTKGVRFAIPSA